MSAQTYNVLFGTPLYNDPLGLYTPTYDGGHWLESLPRENCSNRYLAKVARTIDAAIQNTRIRCDLKADRLIRVVQVPKHNISSAGYARVLGVPSSMVFAYEAGMDVVAAGGTFTRTPTSNVLAASYVNRDGVVKYAGENLALQSAAFGTTWSASNVTVTSNTVANPYDATVTAETLTASAGNGTVIQDLGVLSSAAFVFSIWLKRKTGTGTIALTLDGGATYTTVTLTTYWQRFQITQTLANPDCGIKIVTSGDAVYAWGAQAEHGSTATGYVPTTTTAQGAIRDGHYTSGVRGVLLEDTRANLCLRSETFGTTWAAVGTPSRSAAAHTTSGVSLDLIGDDDGAALEGYTQTITFAGNAVKAISIKVKQGSSTSSVIRLRDTTAGADRLLAVITWSGTVPVITMTTGTSHGYVALYDGVYRILLATTNVTAANTNSLQVYPATTSALATASTGTIYAGGVQAENGSFPSSYIPTTSATVTRNAENLSFVFSSVADQTFYLKYVNRGSDQMNDATYLAVGSGTTAPRIQVYNSGGTNHQALVDNSSSSASTGVAQAVAYGSTVELRVVVSVAMLTVGHSIDGAAEAIASTVGVAAPVAWSSNLLTINSRGGSGGEGFAAFSAVRIATGTKTLAEMQAIVYDSGWVQPYPSGQTAETLVGTNYPWTVIVNSQTGFTGRYWYVQIDDPANTSSYIELARLCICGGYQPSYNMIYGARWGLDTSSSRTETDGGAYIHDARAVRRLVTLTLPGVTDSEWIGNLFQRQRILGTSGQFVYVDDPTASVSQMFETAFLATFRELSQGERAFYNANNVPVTVVEEL